MYHDTYQSQYAIIIANNMRVAEVSLCLAAYLIVPESCVSNYWAIRAVYSWSRPTSAPEVSIGLLVFVAGLASLISSQHTTPNSGA